MIFWFKKPEIFILEKLNSNPLRNLFHCIAPVNNNNNNINKLLSDDNFAHISNIGFKSFFIFRLLCQKLING